MKTLIFKDFIEYKQFLIAKYRLTQHLANMEPELADRCLQHMRACYGAGFLVRVAISVRGQDEQEIAYTKKASNAHFGESPHNYIPCLSYDIVLVNDEPGDTPYNDTSTPDEEEWKTLGALGEKVGLEWGGRWTPTEKHPKRRPDQPHFQLAQWRTRLQGRSFAA